MTIRKKVNIDGTIDTVLEQSIQETTQPSIVDALVQEQIEFLQTLNPGVSPAYLYNIKPFELIGQPLPSEPLYVFNDSAHKGTVCKGTACNNSVSPVSTCPSVQTQPESADSFSSALHPRFFVGTQIKYYLVCQSEVPKSNKEAFLMLNSSLMDLTGSCIEFEPDSLIHFAYTVSEQSLDLLIVRRLGAKPSLELQEHPNFHSYRKIQPVQGVIDSIEFQEPRQSQESGQFPKSTMTNPETTILSKGKCSLVLVAAKSAPKARTMVCTFVNLRDFVLHMEAPCSEPFDDYVTESIQFSADHIMAWEDITLEKA